MGLVIGNVSGWNTQYVKNLQAGIEGVKNPITRGHSFQSEHLHAPQSFASPVQGHDFPDGVVRGSVLTKPVFRKRLQQCRIRLRLLQEGQDGAVVGVFSQVLDALEVVCGITMDG